MALAAALAAALLAGRGLLSPAAPAAEPTPAADAEEWGGLPAGPGREEVFYVCQRCHSLAIVKQQGLDRASWDESLVWMVEEQEMEPLEPKERALVLDYLATHFGRGQPRRRRLP